MFFELRQYRTQPGKREEWVAFMESEIIPFQISKGMVVIGSFVGEEEDDLYVWIRRFESEEQREQLYKARINPVINQNAAGAILFGDKTALSF